MISLTIQELSCRQSNKQTNRQTNKFPVCALILFIQTLALYKSFTYLLTYLFADSHKQTLLKITPPCSGVFRNLKRGCSGHISGVHFQKCPKFSIIYHIKYKLSTYFFISKEEGAGTRAPTNTPLLIKNASNTNLDHRRRSSVNFGGTKFLPEKYVWKINKLPEFYMILARKIIKMPEFL